MGVFNTRPRFDDTQIKQLTGDTITLSGTTNISGTFRYIPGATTGNFLKASDPQGTLEWAPISAITWAISACTSPLYVSTIEACPNPTDPLYIEAGEVQFGTSPNSIITDITNTRVGVGTGSPTERLHVSGGNILLNNNLDGRASITVDNFSVSNDASSILRVCVSGNSLSQCAYGVVSAYGPDAAPTGSFGGSYLPNSLTIATSNGTQPERLHINIGSRRAGDAQTRFFGGSNDFDSSSLLGVFYTSGLTITDTLNTDTLRVRDGATSGYVLTSDAQGNASWQFNSTGFSGNTSGTCITDIYVTNLYGCSPLHIEPSGINDVYIVENGGNVGIGNISPQEKLHVSGDFLINNTAETVLTISAGTFNDAVINFDNSGASTPFAQIRGNTFGGGASGNLEFYTYPSGGPLTKAMTIANDGQVGIGTINNNDITEQLHVEGSVRIVDGTEQNGYVLTCDANGVGSWQPATSGTTGGATIDPYNDVGTTTTINWDVSGTSTNYEVTLNGNGTLNLQNVRNGDYGTIIVEQDGVGGHTLAFGTINGGAGTHRVVNGGAGAPTLTVNANAIDILSFTYNGSVMYWTVGNDYT